jgi:micrococcal nuclease
MYEYKASIESVVDGDTVDAIIDLGFKTSMRQRLRLARIDTQERGQDGYAQARDFVTWAVLDKPVKVRTEKTSKWGYYIAEITLPDGQNLSDALVEAGLAKPYDGGKKQ